MVIPLTCREKFRFKDAKGDLFEMNAMPMGHRCAPEIMHVLTATLAGDKQFCTADAAFSSDNAEVYIDGIRFAGSEVIAEQYVRFVDNRAREVNARFKDAGAPPSQTYTFNGITYHHGLGKVSLGPKLTRRLTQDDFATATGYVSTSLNIQRTAGGSLPYLSLDLTPPEKLKSWVGESRKVGRKVGKVCQEVRKRRKREKNFLYLQKKKVVLAYSSYYIYISI